MLKCPNCGGGLMICTSTVGQWSRKIKKNGKPGKIINKDAGRPTGQGEFLSCQEYCGFIYDFWNQSERNKEFDDWYDSDEEGFFEC